MARALRALWGRAGVAGVLNKSAAPVPEGSKIDPESETSFSTYPETGFRPEIYVSTKFGAFHYYGFQYWG